MQIRTVLIYFSCILLTLSAAASPARRGPLVLTQPDGTSFIALIQGDEFAKIKTEIAAQLDHLVASIEKE